MDRVPDVTGGRRGDPSTTGVIFSLPPIPILLEETLNVSTRRSLFLNKLLRIQSSGHLSSDLSILSNGIQLPPKIVYTSTRKLSSDSFRSLLVVGCVIEQMTRKARRIQWNNALQIARVDPDQLNASTPILDGSTIQTVEAVIWKIVRTISKVGKRAHNKVSHLFQCLY